MKSISKLLLFGALLLVMVTAACGAEEGATPTLVGTSFPDEGDLDLTGTPFGGDLDGTAVVGTAETETTVTAETPAVGATDAVATQATDAVATQATADGTASAGITRTPGIPVTGLDIVLVECQFCIDTQAHALLVLPDTATFEVVSPATTTTTSTAVNTETRCSTVEVNNGKQVVLCSAPEMTPITLNICTDSNTCTDFPVDLLACPLTQTNTTPGAAGASTATPSTIINTPTP